MKNLANCTPTEFVAQTVKIKKVAKDWMDATKIIDILRTPPKYVKLPENATDEVKAEIFKRNLEIQQEQGMENFSRIFDASFEENPQKTLDILALCCFEDPKNVDSHPMSWYMKSIQELLEDEVVVSFFSSLAQLGQKNISKR